MITPIENAADLADQQDISYGTLEGGKALVYNQSPHSTICYVQLRVPSINSYVFSPSATFHDKKAQRWRSFVWVSISFLLFFLCLSAFLAFRLDSPLSDGFLATHAWHFIVHSFMSWCLFSFSLLFLALGLKNRNLSEDVEVHGGEWCRFRLWATNVHEWGSIRHLWEICSTLTSKKNTIRWMAGYENNQRQLNNRCVR